MERYDSYKDSDVKWLGEIPSHWEVNKAKYYLYSKKSIAGKDSTKYQRLALTLNGIIKRQDGDDLGLNPDKLDTYQIVDQNDLIFKLIDLENYKTSRVGLTPYKGIVSPAYIRLKCRGNINMRYMEYYYLNMWYRHIFNDLGSPGVRSNLSSADLLNLSILIPLLKEQDAIVSFLDEATSKMDAAIAQQQKMIDLLNERKQIIINNAVTKGLDPSVPLKDSGIDWIGKIPAHWEVVRLKYLLSESKERSLSGNEEPLSMSQIYGLIPTKEMNIIPNMASSFVGAKIVRKGDLVFNKLKAHLGVFNVSRYNGLVSPDYAVYSSTGRVNLAFLEYIFKTPKCIHEFIKLITGVGAGLSRLYTSDLYSIYCAIPSIEEQTKICKFIEERTSNIRNAIINCQKQISLLQERKQIIINDVVTGKVKIV